MHKYFRKTITEIREWADGFTQPILETRELTIPLIAISIGCFILWQLNVFDLKDFGLNAFTEILGIIVTIVFVEQLIRRQELQRTLPVQVAAYEDIRLLTTRIVRFWESLFYLSVPREILPDLAEILSNYSYFPSIQQTEISTVNQLFSQSSINLIRLCLDLDSKADVTPAQTWWAYLPQKESEFYHSAERILERYSAYLEPKAFNLVHQLTRNFLHPDTGMRNILAMRSSDQEMGFPRAHHLAAYWGTSAESLETIVKLNNWCIQQKKFLEKNGISDLIEPVYELNRHPSYSPRCTISSTKLLESMMAVKAYREQSS